MELFPDGAHLRLRRRACGRYLNADVDGVGIILRDRHGTLNEAWAVHRLERDGASYVLLQSAAYGGYVAVVQEEAPPASSSSGQGEGDYCHTVCRVLLVQRVNDGPGQDDVLWQVLGADDRSDDVLLRHRTFGLLRDGDEQRTAMQWMVESIPPRADSPELLPVVPPPAVPVGGPSVLELFPDGAHLRLRSRARGRYLNAEEDGVGIILRDRRGTLNEAWAVHRLERDGASYVLLRSAAYGRYLATVQEEAPPASSSSGQGEGDYRHTGCRVVQRVYDAHGEDDVLWEVLGADDGSDDVLLRHRTFGICCDDQGTAMQWMVEAIPPRADPPELPLLVPPPAVPVGGPIRRRSRVVQPLPVLRRIIYYVRADNQGNFSPLVWRILWFYGRSVSHLRGELAAALGVEEDDVLDITLCARAGSNGRLTPLVIDLPSDDQSMDIVVLNTGSPAAEALVHPDVGAP